jgi:hypothetical protein
MRKMIFLLLLLTVTSSAFAQNSNCTLGAWVEDKDPAGTNIRESAGTTAKIVANVPYAKEDGETAMLDVIGYSNGWLKVTRAETVDGNSIFKGFGWISAKKVGFAIQNTKGGKNVPLYSRPDRTSKTILQVPETAKFLITGFDCFGFKISYKGKHGWIAKGDSCGNPVTTCS